MKKIGFGRDHTHDLKISSPDHCLDTTNATNSRNTRSPYARIIRFGLFSSFTLPHLNCTIADAILHDY
ncbi:hypothetical protein L596_009012 [Steinernema carpocapsae]|uniref:Uncharacterized protein n=1 Tax=Steinernema carpocapsae TaxID=34508 RepID=A0A4U5PE65_STECR|nr:hypothetical protein L596_009012 [Steinernema carpocapsae]